VTSVSPPHPVHCTGNAQSVTKPPSVFPAAVLRCVMTSFSRKCLKDKTIVTVKPQTLGGPAPLWGVPTWENIHKHFFITAKAFKFLNSFGTISEEYNVICPSLSSARKGNIMEFSPPYFSDPIIVSNSIIFFLIAAKFKTDIPLSSVDINYLLFFSSFLVSLQPKTTVSGKSLIYLLLQPRARWSFPHCP